jgi:uncharacterized protein YcaQ
VISDPARDEPVRLLTRTEARRIAVRAQLLEATRPPDLAAVVDRLTFLQIDPTAAIAPAADLVAWSRLGRAYQPAQLQRAVETERSLFELRSQPTVVEPRVMMLRPMADLHLFLAEMAATPRPGGQAEAWLRANDGFRRRVLDQLGESGPLSSRDVPDTSEVGWQSTGWTHERNVTQMLEFLLAHGEIAVAARRGRERLWDLAERIYPAAVRPVPADEARRIRDERWLRALGVARRKFVGAAGVAAEIEGTKGSWRVDPQANGEGFEGRTALLSPFDRLTHDRARARDLFDFEYYLEMYKPKEKRRWGFFAMPILHGDGLVGKLDAAADRAASTLRVQAVHQDIPLDRPTRAAVKAEVAALAQWLGLDRVRYA